MKKKKKWDNRLLDDLCDVSRCCRSTVKKNVINLVRGLGLDTFKGVNRLLWSDLN
jgi:hypothetical protein